MLGVAHIIGRPRFLFEEAGVRYIKAKAIQDLLQVDLDVFVFRFYRGFYQAMGRVNVVAYEKTGNDTCSILGTGFGDIHTWDPETPKGHVPVDIILKALKSARHTVAVGVKQRAAHLKELHTDIKKRRDISKKITGIMKSLKKDDGE